MGYILDSDLGVEDRDIPKIFLNLIRVSSGPFEGAMAHPCLCGYPTDIDDPDVALIRWDRDGRFMYVHRECVPAEDDDA